MLQIHKIRTKTHSQTNGGLFLVPWTEDATAEEEVQKDCKATIRCACMFVRAYMLVCMRVHLCL